MLFRSQEFKGSITENYIAQELVHSQYPLYYWTSEGQAELDFLVENEEFIYPLEVKSGNSSKKKSLRLYGDLYQPKVLIRTSPMNLKKDGNIFNCPLYLIEKIRFYLSILNENS